jgi:hypothetical protein
MEVRILSVLLVVVGGNIRWPSLQRPPLRTSVNGEHVEHIAQKWEVRFLPPQFPPTFERRA